MRVLPGPRNRRLRLGDGAVPPYRPAIALVCSCAKDPPRRFQPEWARAELRSHSLSARAAVAVPSRARGDRGRFFELGWRTPATSLFFAGPKFTTGGQPLAVVPPARRRGRHGAAPSTASAVPVSGLVARALFTSVGGVTTIGQSRLCAAGPHTPSQSAHNSAGWLKDDVSCDSV